MTVEGPYINVASFLYKISQLPRIVHVNSIKMAKPTMVEGELLLATNITGTTYHFVETPLPDDVLGGKDQKSKGQAGKK